MLVTPPSFPPKTVTELITLLKANPDKYSYASGGAGAGAHLSAEMFKHITGTKLVHVPYKGNAPATYGGRLSSVMDAKMKDGNSKRFSVSGGLGLIASRLTLESPIVKDKGSFIVSGRRTYADVFLPLWKDPGVKNAKLYFYDFKAKANYKFNSKNKIVILENICKNKYVKFLKYFVQNFILFLFNNFIL
mgnify:CR=1 FL=1